MLYWSNRNRMSSMESDGVLREDRSVQRHQTDQSYVKRQLDSIYQQMACILMRSLIHYQAIYSLLFY